jgi:hypothetical protein
VKRRSAWRIASGKPETSRAARFDAAKASLAAETGPGTPTNELYEAILLVGSEPTRSVARVVEGTIVSIVASEPGGKLKA